MFLSKDTRSIIQPMDKGIFLAAKRIYRKRFLNEVVVVLEVEEDGREQRPLKI